MAITSYGDISQRTAAYAATEMLSHAEPILVLSKFGQSKPLPKNKADTVKFRRPVPFANVTVALSEGVTPSSQQMAYEDVTVQIKQWGAWTEITDVVHDLAEDPVLADASMLCGEQAAETIEYQTWGAIRAGTNVFFANGSTRSAVNSVYGLAKQRAVTRSLKATAPRRSPLWLAALRTTQPSPWMRRSLRLRTQTWKRTFGTSPASSPPSFTAP